MSDFGSRLARIELFGIRCTSPSSRSPAQFAADKLIDCLGRQLTMDPSRPRRFRMFLFRGDVLRRRRSRCGVKSLPLLRFKGRLAEAEQWYGECATQ